MSSGTLKISEGHPLIRLVNIHKGGPDACDKSSARLRQGNAPRRARKQWRGESVLYTAYGVTDRRWAHAEVSRRCREAPVANYAPHAVLPLLAPSVVRGTAL